MSNAQRALLLVAAVVVLGGALILLSPGSDDGNDTAATATTPAATTPPAGRETQATAPATTTAEPRFQIVTVEGGRPAGGVQTITAHKDDVVRIEVASPDTTSEVHLHGYDIKRDLEAGGRARFVFTAKNEGIFEMELEDTAVQIVKLVIEP